MGAFRASYPRFRREGEPSRVEITDDDVVILKLIYRHRFVRAEDLYRLFPERTPDRLSRRLTLLFRAEYLERPIAQIDRYQKGGSKTLVYGLGSAGAKYLKEALKTPVGSTDWRSRNRTYTRENLDHTLAVARFLIDLELACRRRGDVSVIPFEEIVAAAPDGTRRSSSATSWTVPIQWGGSTANVQIAPDAIFGLRKQRPDGAQARAYFFLEIDRGTMTILPSEKVQESDAFLYRATLLRKFVTYLESWKQKLHREHFGIGAPRTLFVTSNAKRKASMARAGQQVGKSAHAPDGLFLFGSDGGDPLSMRFTNLRLEDTRLIALTEERGTASK